MLKLRVKWTLFVVLIEVAALLLSGGISALVANALLTEQVRASEQDLAELVLRVHEEEELPFSRFEELFREHSVFRLSALAQMPDLPQEQLDQLAQGELVSTGRGDKVVTYFALSGVTAVISPSPANALASQATLRWLLNTLLMFGVGLVAMWTLSMAISKPIVALTQAARSVAGGDFSAKVPLRPQTKKRPYDEIEELSATFNHMTDELKSFDYLRKDFISNVSHEIKSPLTTISGYAQLLADETLDAASRREYIHNIRLSCAQLSGLCENLTRISQLESGKRKPIAQPFSLDEQLRRTVAAMMPEFRRRGHELTVDLTPAFIVSDKLLLEQVWQNLLYNAAKFTPDGGHISLSLAAQEDGRLCVRVKDTGVGIAPEKITHIFEKFYQADSSHHTEGSGLGLSLVKRILDACGGEIAVQSELGHGSTFTVTLPAANHGAQPGARPS